MHSAAKRGMKGEKAPIEADTGVDPLVMRTNVLYCLDCGKCTGTCPVTAVKPGFSPRRLVEMTLMAKPEEIATNNYIWDCLTCGKCSNYCPTDVRFSDYIKGLRARALEQGVRSHSRTEALPLYIDLGRGVCKKSWRTVGWGGGSRGEASVGTGVWVGLQLRTASARRAAFGEYPKSDARLPLWGRRAVASAADPRLGPWAVPLGL